MSDGLYRDIEDSPEIQLVANYYKDPVKISPEVSACHVCRTQYILHEPDLTSTCLSHEMSIRKCSARILLRPHHINALTTRAGPCG